LLGAVGVPLTGTVQFGVVVVVPFGRASEHANVTPASSAWNVNVAVRLTVLAAGAVSIAVVGPVGVVAAASGAAPVANDRAGTEGAGAFGLVLVEGVGDELADSPADPLVEPVVVPLVGVPVGVLVCLAAGVGSVDDAVGWPVGVAAGEAGWSATAPPIGSTEVVTANTEKAQRPTRNRNRRRIWQTPMEKSGGPTPRDTLNIRALYHHTKRPGLASRQNRVHNVMTAKEAAAGVVATAAPPYARPVTPLQKVAMGLLVVFLRASFGGYDALPDPVGWGLALAGLWQLRGQLPNGPTVVALAAISSAVSIPLVLPALEDRLTAPGQWALSLPQTAFCVVLCSALAASEPASEHEAFSGVADAVRGRFAALRWVFVAIGAAPVLVYGGGLDALAGPVALLAVLANVYLVYLLLRVSGRAASRRERTDDPTRPG
jgi:hypothetical protein